MNRDIVAEIITIPVKVIDDAVCQVDLLDHQHAAEQPATDSAISECVTDQGMWNNGWLNSWTK